MENMEKFLPYMKPLISLIVVLVPVYIGYLFGKSRDKNHLIFDRKLDIYSKIVTEISSHNYLKRANQIENNTVLIELFAPARLIGGKAVINELREYFSLVVEYYHTTISETKDKVTNKISKCAMELEQLMRDDLGKSRHLSKIEILLNNRFPLDKK
jgi:hypothetical protein